MNFRQIAVLGVIATLLPLCVNAQDGISLKSTEVAPGLFMVTGEGGFVGGNMAILVGKDHVAMIDDGMKPLAPKLLAHVAETAGRPVDMLINTHVHGDHTGANAAFAEQGTLIFAHDNIRKRLVEKPEDAGGEAGIPVVTFHEGVTFHLNGLEARVIHLPSAHTDGDSIIHFPGANVIHTGDVGFHNLFPYIDLDSGGSVSGFIAGQEAILDLADEETKIIPGHGELTDQAGLAEDLRVLKSSRMRVAELMQEGHEVDAILAANPLEDFAEYHWNFITTERMIRTLVRDLSENQ